MISRPCRLASFFCLIAVSVSVFLAADVELRGATITAASVSLVDVSAAVVSAVDGDTVIVPSGTATWTSQLAITNAITLIGQTTTDSVAGTAVDNTIIIDNLPSTQDTPLIVITSGSGKSYRLSGFTFQDARTTLSTQGYVSLSGQSQAVRVDHCHFTTMPDQAVNIHVGGGVYGVADHNVLEPAHTQFFDFENGNQGSSTTSLGNPAWAAATAWGSGNFFFAEDNYVNCVYTRQQVVTDGNAGARFVFRHNHCWNSIVYVHGTEGAARGGRAMEVYGNDFHNSFTTAAGGGIRSGGLLFYNNTYSGTPLSGNFSIQVYRTFASFGPTWGNGADGSSFWDVNDTEGNGTWVEGHTPYLYFPASGYATCANPSASATQILDASAQNWLTDKWKGFGVRRLSDSQINLITGNNANTLFISLSQQSSTPSWVSGNQYQIHKVLVALDQSSRGQGDLVSCTIEGGTTVCTNTETNSQAWPHQVLDPCYGWNNKQGTTNITITAPATGGTTFVENRDFYNEAIPVGGVQMTGVGIGTLANRPANGVAGTDITGVTTNPPGTAYWATDVPSVNASKDNGALYVWSSGAWVLYYQPYTYPHPLVSGVLSAPTNLRIVN